MAKPTKWVRISSVEWERRSVGAFTLYASTFGRFEVMARDDMLDREDTGGDLAHAKQRAEESLRKVLTEALAQLGEQP
jgi:hypothetical protein